MNLTYHEDNLNFSDDLQSKNSDPSQETQKSERERKLPIPPPSDPKQYRAIGLIKGQYQQSSSEQLTKGRLITSEATFEAVLLGRVISLVKNHLDLNEPHLWVVYPRTKQLDDRLHVQIIGVWEPETLDPNATDSQKYDRSTRATQDGYFSIRGEVIFYSQETETTIVKIQQLAKKDSDKAKFFKIKLKGSLPSHKPLNHFWDFQVKLESNILVIAEATDIGLLHPQKQKPSRKKERSQTQAKSDSRPLPKTKKSPEKKKQKPSVNKTVSKAMKRPERKDLK